MRKILIVSLFGLLCLPALTWAEEGSLKTVPAAGINTGPKAKLEETRAAIEAKKKENQDKRQENRADRIKNYLDRLIQRLNNSLGQLNGLITRVDAYLKQLETRGVNTAEARTKLKEASEAILSALGTLTALPGQIGTPANPDKLTPAEAQKIRTAVKPVVESVKTAHQKVQDLLKAVRAARASIIPPPVPKINEGN